MKTGAVVVRSPVAMIKTVSEPEVTLSRSKKCGRMIKEAADDTRTIATAMPINQCSIDLILPSSPSVLNLLRNFENTKTSTVIGAPTDVANCVSGNTAPRSSCPTYFGTRNKPTYALTTSPNRKAANIRSEYHQKSPRRA